MNVLDAASQRPPHTLPQVLCNLTEVPYEVQIQRFSTLSSLTQNSPTDVELRLAAIADSGPRWHEASDCDDADDTMLRYTQVDGAAVAPTLSAGIVNRARPVRERVAESSGDERVGVDELFPEPPSPDNENPTWGGGIPDEEYDEPEESSTEEDSGDEGIKGLLGVTHCLVSKGLLGIYKGFTSYL